MCVINRVKKFSFVFIIKNRVSSEIVIMILGDIIMINSMLFIIFLFLNW